MPRENDDMKKQNKTDYNNREIFCKGGIGDVDLLKTSESPPRSCVQDFSDDKMSSEKELGCGSVHNDFFHGSTELLLPAQVNVAQSSVETEKLELFRNLLLSAHLQTAVKEDNINLEFMKRVKDVLDEQYKKIKNLKAKLNQRETAIKHLEEIVLLLQKSMELKCTYYDQRLLHECSKEIPVKTIDNLQRQLLLLKEKVSEHFREEEKNGETMNLIQMQLVDQSKIIYENAKKKQELNEAISQLQRQVVESNEVISALSRTLAKQQLVRIGEKTSQFQKNTIIMDKMVQMKKKISGLQTKLTEAIDSKGSKEEDNINELKCLVEDMQAKILEKNNTNFALVGSVKRQSETIAYLRSEIKYLQDKIDLIQGQTHNFECH